MTDWKYDHDITLMSQSHDSWEDMEDLIEEVNRELRKKGVAFQFEAPDLTDGQMDEAEGAIVLDLVPTGK